MLCNEINPSSNIFPNLKKIDSNNIDSNIQNITSDSQNNNQNSDDYYSKSKLLNLVNKNENIKPKKVNLMKLI